MNTNTIICPHCKKDFQIDEVFRHQVEEDVKKQSEEKFQKDIEKIKLETADTIKKELEEKNKTEVLDLQKQLQEQKTKNDELREKELQLRENARKLEEDKKEFELKIQRQLDEDRKKIEEQVLKSEEEKHHLKDLEKEKVIEDLKKALDDAQRKANQGSQQTQGEAFELEFEQILKREFPNDIISEVGKGIKGGDIIQEVIDSKGNNTGKILWELKNTKTWSEPWIDKLKGDKRTIQAEDAVLITEVLPNDMKSSGAYRNGVWVTKRDSVVGIASVLRAKLIQLNMAKQANNGKDEKMNVLFTYLSGTEFKHRVEAILEAWTGMQDDIEKEKRYFANKWARDDKHIRQVIDSTIGMRGDLEGIMGNSLPEIKGLDLLEDGDK